MLAGCGEDKENDIRQSQYNLIKIGEAIKLFESEAYFAKKPEDLKELYKYKAVFQQEMKPTLDVSDPKFERKFEKKVIEYSLIPDVLTFYSPTYDLDEQEEIEREVYADEIGGYVDTEKPLLRDARDKERPTKTIIEKKPREFRCDYTLLPWYDFSLPDNTIIAWDNPGNFNTGGNVLLKNGTVYFLNKNMSAKKYAKFIEALKTRSNRDFVRKVCVDNHVDASLNGFKMSEVEPK